jgi:hypothetical protein
MLVLVNLGSQKRKEACCVLFFPWWFLPALAGRKMSLCLECLLHQAVKGKTRKRNNPSSQSSAAQLMMPALPFCCLPTAYMNPK